MRSAIIVQDYHVDQIIMGFGKEKIKRNLGSVFWKHYWISINLIEK